MWRSPGPQNAAGLHVLEHSRPRLWGCSKAIGRISRSPDHPITRSPDFPITRFLRFPDHPIFRSSDQPMMPSLSLIPRSKGLSRNIPLDTSMAQARDPRMRRVYVCWSTAALGCGVVRKPEVVFPITRSPDHQISRSPDHQFPDHQFPISDHQITDHPITRSPDHPIFAMYLVLITLR
jgi:hypothetical protein